IHFLQDCGVEAIELGIPFSDPVADGPTVQAAGERALAGGTTLTGVLEMLRQTKETRTIPIILMTYLNPIYAYGINQFTLDREALDVDGISLPDIPSEEESGISAALNRHDIAFIRFAALTRTKERLAESARRSECFLYAVSVTGSTGARISHGNDV